MCCNKVDPDRGKEKRNMGMSLFIYTILGTIHVSKEKLLTILFTPCASFRGSYKKWVSIHKDVTQQPSVKEFQDEY